MGTWNYVLNAQFAEQHGQDAQASFVEMLGEVAARVRPGDRDGANALLDEGLARIGLDLASSSRHQLADNLTMAEHDAVAVSDEMGGVLATFDLPGDAGISTPEAQRHIEPESDDRPTYS